MTRSVAIIGGGATGLAAAYQLKRAQDAGADITFALFERDSYLGGKVAGEIVPDPITGEPFIVDGGPDCYSSFKPAAMRIARAAGIGDQRIPSNEARKAVYIWRDGKMHRLPDGFTMFVPTKIAPVFETELLTEQGKREIWRDLTELAAPREEGVRYDESLESFVLRRFGREVLDYLAEPFLGGVHASDPKSMSLAATFPMYLDMEARHGSVIRGTALGAAARERAAAGKPKDPNNTVFSSFRLGMHQLTDAMADAAGREHLHTENGVRSITRGDAQNGTYRIELESGEVRAFDAVVIATESNHGATLSAGIDTDLSEALAGIPNITSATCSIAFKADEVGMEHDGFGVLIPAVEKRDLLAATWSSTKWSNRAPEGRVLVRGFIGTPHNQEIMEKSDEELTEIVLRELREVMGISPDAEPLFSRFYRWTLGMSQYTMGHLDRVETIEARCSEIPGVGVGGGCLRGVGVPNCIESGEAAARKVLGDLGYADVAETLRAECATPARPN